MIASSRRNSLSLFLLIFLAWSLGGCINDYLVFTTGTKFGIDISQQADQPPNVLLGYKRVEIASIPVPKGNASKKNDVYSVLGNFCVKTDPVLIFGQAADSLQIRSVFSTGMAAQEIANNPAMQTYFAKHAFGIGLRKPGSDPEGPTNKECF